MCMSRAMHISTEAPVDVSQVGSLYCVNQAYDNHWILGWTSFNIGVAFKQCRTKLEVKVLQQHRRLLLSGTGHNHLFLLRNDAQCTKTLSNLQSWVFLLSVIEVWILHWMPHAYFCRYPYLTWIHSFQVGPYYRCYLYNVPPNYNWVGIEYSRVYLVTLPQDDSLRLQFH